MHTLKTAARPKLIDMKLTPREKREEMPMPMKDYKGPDYPYELRITLDEDAMKKLGMKLPKVGDKIEIMGAGSVLSVSSNSHASERGGERSSQRVEIQLKRIQVCK